MTQLSERNAGKAIDSTDELDASRGCRDPRKIMRLARVAILLGFAVSLCFQWDNAYKIAQADGIAYITGGLNLVKTGSFTNPLGKPETWFPPLYPLLIGVFSLGGALDPVSVGRLICAVSGLAGLLLVWQAARWGIPGKPRAALWAMLLLAGNPIYQNLSLAVMSHATATTLGLAGFVVWLKMKERATARSCVLLGLLIGAAYLVRPEVVLVLPLWLLIDGSSYGFREAARRVIYSGLACAIMVFPYVLYLHQATGRWQLSGKAEVTVAVGRGQFYGGPRDYIDPDTLEWKYQQHEVTPLSEMKRYLFNLRRGWNSVWNTIRGPVGMMLLAASLLGTWRLAAEKRWRFLWGLLVQLSFLAAVIATWCDDRMIHAAWPVVAILAGVGCEQLLSTAFNNSRNMGLRLACFVLLAWGALGWLENATREPRWSWGAGESSKVLLRDAGLAFRKQIAHEPKPATIELGATVGYYAGAYRRLMPTFNDLDTLIRFTQKEDLPHHPTYLVLWTAEARVYHKTIREPFLADRLPFPKVLEMSRKGERVVIYQIPPSTPKDKTSSQSKS